MADALSALRSSVDRLAGLVRPLDDAAIRNPAYPSEWTIADVLSHLGSGAIIGRRRLDDALTGDKTPDDFNPGVWNEWNAKSPRAKVDDSVVADLAFVARLETVSPEQQRGFKSALGPFEVDWDGFVRVRLNEHLLHEWDVAVVGDPDATLGSDGTPFVVDNLDLVARFTARPVGSARTITVHTSAPERSFTVTIKSDGVDFAPSEGTLRSDLTMPAESFVRLIYGRLDSDHTPSSVEGDAAALDQLRSVFRGP